MILKSKHRYILAMSTLPIEAYSEPALLSQLLAFMGYVAYAFAHPSIIKAFSSNLFVIRCNRSYEKQVIAALAFVKELQGKPIGIYTLKTSGTLKSINGFASTITIKG